MKKLKLNLDALVVDAFPTNAATRDEGTVVAHVFATTPYTSCFTCVTCVGVTCP